eukprot:10609431-Alexandrium_andersonii.AAC.1
MSASLVGSEMCIRDRLGGSVGRRSRAILFGPPVGAPASDCHGSAHGILSVSYTHLTLPTICSV